VKQPVHLRPARSSPAEAGIGVLREHLKPLSFNILAEFVKLHFAALVRYAEAGVDGDDHVTMSALFESEVNAKEGFDFL
jgi:hypothetical protein